MGDMFYMNNTTYIEDNIKGIVKRLAGSVIIYDKSYYLIKLNNSYLSYSDAHHLLSHLMLISDGKYDKKVN